MNSLFNYINTSSTWSYSRGNSVGSALKSVLSSYQHLLTNVNQQELIRPLLRIVTPTISKMLSEKFLKTMSKHLPNLPEEVEKVFSATALMIQARYSGNYTKEFLLELEDFFIASFGLGKKLIKTKTNEMWQVTFGVLPKDEVPPALASVLKKCGNPNLRAQWSQEEVVSFPSSTENSSQSLIVTAEPAIANAINRKVTPKKSPPPQDSTSKPEDVSEMKPPTSKPLVKKGREQAPKKKSLSPLEDESSQDFVPIKSKAPKKRVLTEHQKDVLTSRHDDIPALYSELSRDDSVINLPSQFMSQPSMEESLATTDLWDKIKGENEPKKVETSDPGGKDEDSKAETEEHLNGGSQSLLEVEKKTLMKELKNKRFELKLEDTPKAEKNAQEETKKLRSKRKRKDETSEGDKKRTKLDFTENSEDVNGKDKTKEAIADALFRSSQSNPNQTDDPDSVEIVIPDPKPVPETVTLQSSDEMTENVVNAVEKNSHIETNGMGLSQAKKDLPKVNVKVHKLSPVDTKKYMYHDKDVSAPVKKKLFGEVANDSQDDSSAASFEDDIIQSSQPQAKELEQSRSIRGRRSLAKLDMEVKQMPKKKLTRGKREVKADFSNEGEKRNPFGETALHAAAKKGDVSKVEEQLVAGADPNVTDNAGWYPLHEVSISDKENSVAILNLLIQHGASVDCQNKEGVTPLQEAVENAKDNVMFEKKVEVLLSAGANPDLKTANGKSAFDFAEGNNHLIDLLSKKKVMNVTPVRSSGREKKRSVRLANFVDIDRNDDKEKADGNDAKEKTESAQDNDDKEEKIESENSEMVKDSPNECISGDNVIMNKESPEAMEVDETPNASVKENGANDESSCSDNGDKMVQTSEKIVEELKTDSKERCEGSSSPDANKENVLTNRDDDHANSTKTPFGPLNVLANISGEEKKEKVNPFTAVIEKHKAEIKKRPSLGSAGTSRGAMLLSLSRRSSLDTFSRPPPAALGEPPASPAASFSSPKPELNKAMPWVKYKPSPSSASPSASILKRKGIDADASSNCEDSPVSAKNARLDTSLNGRRVHFNEDPVSDSVEIPRAPDGKHTRKKLQLSGYDQEMFVETKSEAEIEQESQPSQGLYSDSPPMDLGINAIYPDLANSKEPIAVIVPHLATGNWAKILAP